MNWLTYYLPPLEMLCSAGNTYTLTCSVGLICCDLTLQLDYLIEWLQRQIYVMFFQIVIQTQFELFKNGI